MRNLHLVHRPDVIPAASAEYLPPSVVFTVSRRITARKSTAHRQVSAVLPKEYAPDAVTPHFEGLADAQTALFTQLVPESLTLEDASPSGCCRARAGPSPR